MTPVLAEVAAWLRERINPRNVEFWAWMAAIAFSLAIVARAYLLADPAAFAIVLGGCVWVTSLAAAVALYVDRRGDRARIGSLTAKLAGKDAELTLAKDIIRRQAADVLEAQGRAWDAEHARPRRCSCGHLIGESGIHAPECDGWLLSGGPRLRIVEQRTGAHDDLPVADESWLDEITKPGGWV